jgi:hypothetical protein
VRLRPRRRNLYNEAHVELAAPRVRTRVLRVRARQTTTGVGGDPAHRTTIPLRRVPALQTIIGQEREMIVGRCHGLALRITVREPKITAELRAPGRQITTTPPRRVLVIQAIIAREQEMIVGRRHSPELRITVREPKTIAESPVQLRRTITIVPMPCALELQKISQGLATTVEFHGQALPKITAT